MIWEIFAYWNIAELQGVFEAIAMITSTDNYSTLIGAGLLFGIFGAAFAVLTGTQDLVAAFRWFIVSLFMYFILFVPKTDVALIDRTGTVGAVTVSNVPLSIAVFGSVTSKVGDWLTTSYETTMKVIHPSYATEGISFQNNGLLFGEKVLLEAEKAQGESISFRLNMTAFFEKCVFPEFDTGQINLVTVLQSKNMWDAVSNVNPSLFVQLYNTDGTMVPSPVSCTTAYSTVLPAQINNVSDEIIKKMSKKMYPDKDDAVADATLRSSLAGSYNFYLNVSDTSNDIIKQQVLSNTFYDATMKDSINTASAMTRSGAELNYGVLFNVAQNTIPKLRNVIEIILYAVFPIILLMMIVAGSKVGIVLKSYIIGLVWIQLWAPLYAVMNYIISSYNAKELKARALYGNETSAWNSMEIQEQLLGSADVTGMLAMAIPMIAYALVKGGEMAMTSFVSGATRPVESNAGMSAREVAQGNISLGNTSMNNNSIDSMTGFKHDTQPSVNQGANVRMDGMANQYTTTSDGSVFSNTTGRENSGAAYNLQQAVQQRQSFAKAYDQAISASSRANTQATMETGSSIAESGLFSMGATNGQDFREGFGNQYSVGTQETFKQASELAEQLEASGAVKEGQGATLVASIMASLKKGISLDAGALITSSGGVGKTYTSEAVSQAVEGIKKMDKNEVINAASIMEDASQNEAFQKTLGLDETARADLKASNEKSQKLQEASSAELERSEGYKESMSHAEEKVQTAMFNLGAATPFSSLNEDGKRFATGEGATLLGDAMEARNEGNHALASFYMSQFNDGLENFSSQYGAPTAPNVGEVRDGSDVINKHDENVNQTIDTNTQNKSEVARESSAVVEKVESQFERTEDKIVNNTTELKDKNKETVTKAVDIKNDIEGKQEELETKLNSNQQVNMLDNGVNSHVGRVGVLAINDGLDVAEAVIDWAGEEKSSNKNKADLNVGVNGTGALIPAPRPENINKKE